ncbi:CotO family spore coat protein [Amphibacillus cookii]|uniref:CotO family spore coat protein n=1 Tax=Amphibacillus cookii TaxID=767787 RepID=UPI001956356A|nr:CotO family spore coat protein [Amphibacillus cookii]MBM7540183.1 hypothetical protein [Amphibacillus cookii]
MKHRPMMYIAQPDLKAPIAPMQKEYYSTKGTTYPVEPKPRRQGRPILIERDQNIPSTTELEVDEVEDQTLTDEKKDMKPTKFKEMTIEDKLTYLSQPSSFLPRLNCQVKLAGESHKGNITKVEDDQVYFEAKLPPKHRQFQVKDIEDIKLIGFNN